MTEVCRKHGWERPVGAPSLMCPECLADRLANTTPLTFGADNEPQTRCARCNGFETQNARLRAALAEADKTASVCALWCAAALSEGQASKMLGLDRIDARRLREEWEAHHPEMAENADATYASAMAVITERNEAREARDTARSALSAATARAEAAERERDEAIRGKEQWIDCHQDPRPAICACSTCMSIALTTALASASEARAALEELIKAHAAGTGGA